MTYDDIPETVRSWINQMVEGTTSLRVGHMMFSTSENFRTQKIDEGLFLIRAHSKSPVRKWIDGASDEENRKQRMSAARDYTANAVRSLVVNLFENADYPGD